MQGALHFCYKLLCATAEDQGAGFCGRAPGEEVEALVADLALLEAFAGAEVRGLDVRAGGGDGAAAGLDNALEVVR